MPLMKQAVIAGKWLSFEDNYQKCMPPLARKTSPTRVAEMCLSNPRNIMNLFTWKGTSEQLRVIGVEVSSRSFDLYYEAGVEGSPWIHLMLQTMLTPCLPKSLDEWL